MDNDTDKKDKLPAAPQPGFLARMFGGAKWIDLVKKYVAKINEARDSVLKDMASLHEREEALAEREKNAADKERENALKERDLNTYEARLAAMKEQEDYEYKMQQVDQKKQEQDARQEAQDARQKAQDTRQEEQDARERKLNEKENAIKDEIDRDRKMYREKEEIDPSVLDSSVDKDAITIRACEEIQRIAAILAQEKVAKRSAKENEARIKSITQLKCRLFGLVAAYADSLPEEELPSFVIGEKSHTCFLSDLVSDIMDKDGNLIDRSEWSGDFPVDSINKKVNIYNDSDLSAYNPKPYGVMLLEHVKLIYDTYAKCLSGYGITSTELQSSMKKVGDYNGNLRLGPVLITRACRGERRLIRDLESIQRTDSRPDATTKAESVINETARDVEQLYDVQPEKGIEPSDE